VNIVDALFGRALATEEEKAERIGPLKGIPIFGLDALSSAAYGPEAALTLLIPLGMAGATYVWPITIGIVVLLGIVYFSYRQTISAYPQGGGSYTVATENLGEGTGLLAAAALMIDYVLTAAVGISAGVGALVSAVPSLQSQTLTICLAILILITIINLRGVQETGGVFLLPTYVFVACLLGLIAVGVFETLAAGGHPVPIIAPPKLSGVTSTVSAWLLLRTFSSGCTAMTGVEAVSNSVIAFREPTDKYAKLTLTIIIAILMVMLSGIAYLVPAYGTAHFAEVRLERVYCNYINIPFESEFLCSKRGTEEFVMSTGLSVNPAIGRLARNVSQEARSSYRTSVSTLLAH
jgi:amino acid transporter